MKRIFSFSFFILLGIGCQESADDTTIESNSEISPIITDGPVDLDEVFKGAENNRDLIWLLKGMNCAVVQLRS
jgi:hypothetical protein